LKNRGDKMKYIEVNGKIMLYGKCSEMPCNLCNRHLKLCKKYIDNPAKDIKNLYVTSNIIPKAYLFEIISDTIQYILSKGGKK